METFEVNGVKYAAKARQNPTSRRMMNEFMAMSMIYLSAYDSMFGERRKEPARPEVNLISEFRLIQEKKSQLTVSQRAWVVGEFKSHFIKVEELTHTSNQ